VTKCLVNEPCEDNTDTGRLSENIMHFGRVLRAAGLPVGPRQIIDGIQAISKVGIGDRSVFYWALHATYVSSKDQHEIFDQAFHIFWKNPRLLEKMMGLILPTFKTNGSTEQPNTLNRRVQEALQNSNKDSDSTGQNREAQKIDLDSTMTYSSSELLQTMDFDNMSTEEVSNARFLISRMKLTVNEIPIRRYSKAHTYGKIDLRQSLLDTLRNGGDYIPLRYKRRTSKSPSVTAICDISGSMTKYSRMILHFMHVLSNARPEVHTFLFGTRLTNVTRFLRHKDVDEALQGASKAVVDWSGGTRIGDCIREFNQKWSRRVLGTAPIVLFVTDGLDRAGGIGLRKEIDRLQKSCHRLIWLNPLLRFQEFAPKAIGVREILPHVDEFRPVHSLDSLEELAVALQPDKKNRSFEMAPWLDKLRNLE